MAGRPSSIGFGFQSFGQFPFGSADWAEEVTWEITLEFYKEDDAKCELDPPEPLRKFINALKPQFQEIKDRYEQFPDLWDANKVPIAQLDNLGYNFDIFPSENKSEGLRRSEVLNAIQFFLNKGIDNGYEIAAAFSGLIVTITPYWSTDCGDPNAALQEAGPSEFFPRFDSFPADLIPADTIFTDFYEKWPWRVDWIDPCRTSWLDLFFFTPDDTEIEDFSAVAEDVINNVERVRPIHVRINSIRFNGPSVSGGGWTISVAGENAASAGGWTISVIGDKNVVGGGWTIPVVATITP